MSTDLSIPTDFAAHVARLRNLPQHDDPSLRQLFDSGLPIYIARAPGRLDVMGGIGDYSGSLVLEMPIAEAAFAAVQLTRAPELTVASLGTGAESVPIVKTIGVPDWKTLQTSEFEFARKFFAQDTSSAWAAYIVGPVLTFLRDTKPNFAGGLRIAIDSAVPAGKGVSSSAAVEVATMRALAAARKVDLTGEHLARLCQLAENQIAGAACGIMDQLTSALGRKNELLALCCQPDKIEGFVPIPEEIEFWAIDSGVRHSVGGSDYSSVRCGAFMGYRMIADAAGLATKVAEGAPHVVEIEDPIWNGYLANVTPNEFQNRFGKLIPELITGRDFIEKYFGTTDRVTRIDPARTYAVRAPMLHPIGENERAHRFRALLQNPIDEKSLQEMAQLMSAANASYTACGLASSATDLLVDLVCEATPASGLYGAKTTGGGSGGAVAILGRSGADESVVAVAQRYTELTGRATYIFRGSSPGAYSTPVQELVV